MKKRILSLTTALLFLFYVLTYLFLTLNGKYAPAWISPCHPVTVQKWTPLFFADDNGRLKRFPTLFFAPLFYIDMWIWHKDEY